MPRPELLNGYECGACEQWFADINGWAEHICTPEDDEEE